MLLIHTRSKYLHKHIKNKTKRILLFLACAVFICFGVYIGRDIPWGKQSSMYEILRQVGILILGVIGAWLAVLLPFSVEKGDKLKNFFNFSKKLFPALGAAIYLLCLGLVVPLIAEVIKVYSPYPPTIICIFRSASMALLFLGVSLIIYGFSMILSSFDSLKIDIEKMKNAEDVKKKVGPQNKL